MRRSTLRPALATLVNLTLGAAAPAQVVWTQVQASSAPAARYEHASCDLYGVADVLVFGGTDGAALGDVWTLEHLRLAQREPFGACCGPGPWGPAGPHLFTMNAPLIGSTLEVWALTAGQARSGPLLLGAERTPTPFGGCELFVTPVKRIPLQPITDASSFQFAQTEIESAFDSALIGTQQVLQRFEFSSAGRSLSRALRVHVEE